MKRAHLLAREYRIAIDQNHDGACVARCLELPTLRFVSHDLDLAVTSLRQLLAAELAPLVEKGEAPTPLRTSQGPLGAWVEDLDLVDCIEPPSTDLEAPSIETLRSIAQATASRYRVILESQDEYIATAAEVPGPRGIGPTPRQAIASLRDRLTDYALALLQANQLPPEPLADIEQRTPARRAA